MSTKAESNNVRYVQQVLGDVVGEFSLAVRMNVHFNSKSITNGCTIKPSAAANSPGIEIYGQHGQLYTLLMIDPDMPSPTDPTMREWIHWIIADIPGGSRNIDEGKEIMPYMPPSPIRGIHRYILMLYEQKSPLGLVEPPLSREKFDSKDFAQRHDLGNPVGVIYFVSKREPLKNQ